MKSIITTLARWYVRHYLSQVLELSLPLSKQRSIADSAGRWSLSWSRAKYTSRHDFLAHVPVEWINPDKFIPPANAGNPKNTESNQGQRKVILFYHGGGFILGSQESHRLLAVNISNAAQTTLALVEYRLAPENKYPAAHNDCLAAYQALLEQGFLPENIIIGGDSAGGFFTLQTLLMIKTQKLPQPKAAFMISPLCDAIHFDGPSYESHQEVDPWLKAEYIPKLVDMYIPKGTHKPQMLCPITADLKGLPSLMIQVGSDEILLSDSIRLANHASYQNVPCELEIWPRMWHDFQSFAPILPQAKHAIKNIGKFVQKHWLETSENQPTTEPCYREELLNHG